MTDSKIIPLPVADDRTEGAVLPPLPDRMDPGFYARLPLETYLSLPFAGSSTLKLFRRAPALAYDAMMNPKPMTDSQKLGDAIHAAVLEPDRFESTYTVAGQCEATKRDGARCANPGTMLSAAGGWRCGVHGKKVEDAVEGLLILSPADFDAAIGARDSVLVHHNASRKVLGQKDGEVELTGVWEDGGTGLPCKLRGDYVSDLIGTNVDLKTTVDASPDFFSRAIFTWGYYGQQGFYNAGFEELRRAMAHHVIVAVEKKPPYLAAVYRLENDVVKAGREEWLRLLEQFAECQATGTWPGYPDRVQDIGLPGYAWRQLESALAAHNDGVADG